MSNVQTIVKKDVCLWKGHAQLLELFPDGGVATISYDGKTETVEFVPMAQGKDGRAVEGLKPSGKTAIWSKIPYGASVEVVIE